MKGQIKIEALDRSVEETRISKENIEIKGQSDC